MAENFKNNSEQAERATIGAGIVIRGEIAGTEDLLILGSVEGNISLRENVVTVGASAKVGADIVGRIVRVEGEVVGNLTAREQVVVHRSGQVRGNISAPRLLLEDGARLKGSIDTECENQESTFTIEKIRATQQTENRGPVAAAMKNGSTRAADEVPTV